MKQYHILNGDALKSQFPSNIEGELLVARECLVDGPVHGDDLSSFYETRARFIANYDGYKPEDYATKTVPEFEKMLAIPAGSEINLWFEDDLFCQVNWWFVMHLLSNNDNPIYLVRPKEHTKYGFGGLDAEQLKACYAQKTPIKEVNQLAKLWKCYQASDNDALLEAGKALQAQYPFLLPAIDAHIARTPTETSAGRPIESLRSIIQRLNTSEFGPVFKEFCRTESIYGFGDLQVKRMLDELVTKG